MSQMTLLRKCTKSADPLHWEWWNAVCKWRLPSVFHKSLRGSAGNSASLLVTNESGTPSLLKILWKELFLNSDVGEIVQHTCGHIEKAWATTRAVFMQLGTAVIYMSTLLSLISNWQRNALGRFLLLFLDIYLAFLSGFDNSPVQFRKTTRHPYERLHFVNSQVPRVSVLKYS